MIVDYKLLDKMGTEFPDDFSYNDQIHLVRRFSGALATVPNISVKIRENIQDATFFCQINCISVTSNVQTAISIAFSNFGHLALVWSDHNASLGLEDVKEAIIKLLREYGFTPLERRDVSGPYDGIYEDWFGKQWLDRFFAHY